MTNGRENVCRHTQCELSRLKAENASLRSECERMRNGLEGIRDWASKCKDGVQASRFAHGCMTPTGEAVLAMNIEEMAVKALSAGEEKK